MIQEGWFEQYRLYTFNAVVSIYSSRVVYVGLTHNKPTHRELRYMYKRFQPLRKYLLVGQFISGSGIFNEICWQ